MKTIILVLITLSSVLSFASQNALTIPESLNEDMVSESMDVERIQELINQAGQLAQAECKKRNAKALDRIADQIDKLMGYHAGNDQFLTALVAVQKIQKKSLKAKFCQRQR